LRRFDAFFEITKRLHHWLHGSDGGRRPAACRRAAGGRVGAGDRPRLSRDQPPRRAPVNPGADRAVLSVTALATVATPSASRGPPMHGSGKRRGLATLGAAVGTALAAAALAAAPPAVGHGAATTFDQVNLVSDQPGVAAFTDSHLVNAWGMSHGANTPLWVSDNGADVTTLYTAGPGGAGIAPTSLVVSIPGGAPTGQTFNDTTGFVVPGTGLPALFIFAGEDGDLSAWNRSASPMTSAVHVGHVADAVIKGLALVHSPFGPLLLAADFHNNRIDVFDSNFMQLPGDRVFSDPRLPSGFAPFNVAEIGDQVYVTYAKQDAHAEDDVAGRGNGFVDVYTDSGAFVRRLPAHEVLNSPWGLVVAPDSFGRFAGDLLVGNFGDGRIHAFDLRTGALRGTLRGPDERPIAIDGLWGLIQGDDVAGGAGSVWFSAGPEEESHGLLGLLQVH
jgi:uncharacterized protein (TIGR03118 family)